MTDGIVTPRPASDQGVVLADPADTLRRAEVVRTTPRLAAASASNKYALAAVDPGTRAVAGALEAILIQLETINMHLESMSQ